MQDSEPWKCFIAKSITSETALHIKRPGLLKTALSERAEAHQCIWMSAFDCSMLFLEPGSIAPFV
jgi:hypothetical protein